MQKKLTINEEMKPDNVMEQAKGLKEKARGLQNKYRGLFILGKTGILCT
jgi:hypothetical protein